MSDIFLYGALNSGHSYKVRLAMLLGGLQHRYERIDLDVPRNERPEPFRSLAAYGEVPLLVDAGEVLVQSNACLLHLAEKHGILGWQNDRERHLVTRWLFWEANRIGRSYANLRWCRLFGKNENPGLISWFEETAIVDLDRMNGELADQPFLLGHVTIADLSLAGYLLYGDEVGLDMTRWPHVSAWLDRLRALSGWQHPFEAMA